MKFDGNFTVPFWHMCHYGTSHFDTRPIGVPLWHMCRYGTSQSGTSQSGTAQRPTGRGLWLAILLIHFGLLKTTFGLAKRFGYNFPPLH